MKNIAIIGASYLQLPLVRRAKQMGLETHCFAWAEGAVCKEESDCFYPISITEKEQILTKCRQIGIDGICTIASDVAAPTVAYVAEQMGLNSNTYETAQRANNKYMMRRCLSEAGVDCPCFQKITSLSEMRISPNFPLIVKPTDRSGSLGVRKVTDENELIEAVQNALKLSFAHEAIVEEYIEGREISVEFISYKGKHYPLQITDKTTTGAPHFVELAHHQPAQLSQEQFRSIYQLTQKALTALGITNGASHSEYKLTTDGRIVVMEIGARMGGDFIGSDLVQLSTGYDFLQGVIDVALDRFSPPVISQHHFSGVYFLCQQTAAELMPVLSNPCSAAIVDSRITTQPLKAATCSADRNGYLLYQAEKRLTMQELKLVQSIVNKRVMGG